MFKKTLITPTVVLLLLCAGPAFAGGSTQAFAASIDHTSRAIGYSAVGSAQVAAGVSAVPLAAAGALGRASGQAGADLSQFANQPVGEPLPVTDDTITAGPDPARQMQREDVR